MDSSYDKIAAVGLLSVNDRFLVIKRSEYVIAPGKICFPGGTLEAGESAQAALIREFQEEVGLEIVPKQELWTSVTPWRCKVHWWTVHCNLPSLGQDNSLELNVAEVAAVYWSSVPELLDRDDLLESNRQFLELVSSGEISL